ncbi:MAG: gas vesicle protein [Symploca sp. SIO2G7]|nr:gas vesicle protein [Symploca sp. SIO2G7]
MSQSGNFTSGFLLGALVGGIVGGVAGVLTANRVSRGEFTSDQLSDDISQGLATVDSDEQMEAARRGLEDKISELNAAIEEVRQQLGSTNGRATDYETSAVDS